MKPVDGFVLGTSPEIIFSFELVEVSIGSVVFDLIVIPRTSLGRLREKELVSDLFREESPSQREERGRLHYSLTVSNGDAISNTDLVSDDETALLKLDTLGGGGSTTDGWRHHHRLAHTSPLPATLSIDCEWLDFGIPSTRMTRVLREAIG